MIRFTDDQCRVVAWIAEHQWFSVEELKLAFSGWDHARLKSVYASLVRRKIIFPRHFVMLHGDLEHRDVEPQHQHAAHGLFWKAVNRGNALNGAGQ